MQACHRIRIVVVAAIVAHFGHCDLTARRRAFVLAGAKKDIRILLLCEGGMMLKGYLYGSGGRAEGKVSAARVYSNVPCPAVPPPSSFPPCFLP